MTYRFADLYDQHRQLLRFMKTGQHAKIAEAVKAHLFSGLLYIGDRLTAEFKNYFSESKRSICKILAELRCSVHEVS